ncbi:MAG: hypothetical protein B7Z66_02735 [Chromatiales bacterium 21-64-14]|nr:MAG: hypothetical protein B7Z66_02735 [Chromatiales bacterium 21-64-14]HQU14538.1 RDD family protein [Gammaproteobacteria bacterium]
MAAGTVCYAGFWRRVAATLIDVLMLALLSGTLLYLLRGPAYLQEIASDADPLGVHGWQNVVINYVLPLVLTVFMWVRFLGTPGKLLLGCQVVDARTRARLGIRQATVRYFAYLASILPFGLGFLWIGWDRRKQGFHDKIAGSVVIREDESRRDLQGLLEDAL